MTIAVEIHKELKCGKHNVKLAKYVKSAKTWICQVPQCETEIRQYCGDNNAK